MRPSTIATSPLAAGLLSSLAAAGLLSACQTYSMEEVDPQTLVAVAKYEEFGLERPPALLVLQDHSGSMDACFDATPGVAPTHGCMELPNLDVYDPERRSRMDVARQVMLRLMSDTQADIDYGLVLFGADDADPVCGGPTVVADPTEGSLRAALDAYASHPFLVHPRGGTPTTAALRSAYELLVDEATGSPRQEDRQSFVVLVTDGLMNCAEGGGPTCVCAAERGCPTADPSVRLAFGEEGVPLDPAHCLDDAEAIAEVTRLREAGVRTFVVGLGEVFGPGGDDGLARDVLDRLALAGGVAQGEDAPTRFYSAANAAELQDALETIVRQISVPCEHDLDGPVCDGRLLQLSLRIDGEVVDTRCDETGANGTWFFAQREDGSLDPGRIAFSPDICERLRAVERAEIAIRGLENACPEEGPVVGPACSLAAPGAEADAGD